MTEEDLNAILDGIVPAVAESFKDVLARLKVLEEKVDMGLVYEGTHEQGKAYRRNVAVTSDGSIWISRCETRQRPGDSNDWQLAVKRGKDAR